MKKLSKSNNTKSKVTETLSVNATDFFDGRVSSATMDTMLENVSDIDDYLEQNQEHMSNQSLCEHLNQLLIEKNLRVAKVKDVSGLEKAYIYQIFAGQKKPSRDKLIAIAFGLNLTAAETDKLLKVARYKELYSRDQRDAIIKFCLLHEKSIQQTDDILYNRGYQTLSSK